jgi:hypothetical protein
MSDYGRNRATYEIDGLLELLRTRGLGQDHAALEGSSNRQTLDQEAARHTGGPTEAHILLVIRKHRTLTWVRLF